MSRLKDMMAGGKTRVFGRSFAAACVLMQGMGLALTPAGSAMAADYGYTTGARRAEQVEIIALRVGTRTVTQPHSSLNTSRIVGGAMGGALAYKYIGQGNGKTAATVAGAAFGQAVGDEFDKSMDTKQVPVVEFTFKRPNDPSGQMLVLLQDYHDGLKPCTVGQKAILLDGREISQCLIAPSPAPSPAPAAAEVPAVQGEPRVTEEQAKETFHDVLPKREAPAAPDGSVKVEKQTTKTVFVAR